MQILILNGPNLNLLGSREPQIYGSVSFEDFLESLKARFQEHAFTYLQSNHEGALIDALHTTRADGIIINAGAYSHTSIALFDAIKAIRTPTVEVHISNIYQRESFRRHSYLRDACVASICGLGLEGYALGVEVLAHHIRPAQA